MTEECKYCNKSFKNVNLHITKTHTQFTKIWKKNGDFILTRKIDNEPTETAINDSCAAEIYYFETDVKKTKYYDTKDDALYGIYFIPERGSLKQSIGYTCGFTRSVRHKEFEIKNQRDIEARKKPLVATD